MPVCRIDLQAASTLTDCVNGKVAY